MNVKPKKFKILSIDGGGIRGIIPAKVLTELEVYLKQNGKNRKLYEEFDLICGTSTGAIIAIGISLGIPSSELLAFYKKYASDIFPRWIWNLQMIKGIYRPIYSNKRLLKALLEVYQNGNDKIPLLNDAKTFLCIPTFNGGTGEINVLKTGHHSDYTRDFKLPAHHVALSSASAPIYFPPHSFSFNHDLGEGHNINMIDGGVFANNPSLIGLFEATDKLGKDFKDIMILSLGTGKGRHILKQRWKPPSLRYWLMPNPRSFDIMLDSQAQITEQYLSFLNRSLQKKGDEITYLRIQHEFNDKPISLNSSRKRDIEQLEITGEELGKKNIRNIANKFFNP